MSNTDSEKEIKYFENYRQSLLNQIAEIALLDDNADTATPGAPTPTQSDTTS